MRAVRKRYLREFVPAIAGCAVLIVMSGFLAPVTGSLPVRIVLTLLPVLLAICAAVRVLRDQDEPERRIDLESFAIAPMVTGFGFFSFGLLQLADVGWQLRGGAVVIRVLPCLFASFGIAKLLVSRRHRNHA